MDHQAIESFVPILIPLGAFALTAVLVGMSDLAKHRHRQLRHETIRLMVEKGQPIPPELLEERKKPPAQPGNDLANGVKLLSAGIGLSLFLYFMQQRAWPVGFVPAMLGVGYLASHFLASRRPPLPPPAA